MRSVVVSVYQNLGNVLDTANSISLADRQVTVGNISYTVDEQLTKVIPGDMTLKVADHDEAFWTFILNQIQIPTGLLPPFVTVEVDGEREFLGIVQPDKFTRDEASFNVSLTAQDWSVMLANSPLEGDGWTRTLPKVLGTRTVSSKVAYDTDANQGFFGAYGSIFWKSAGGIPTQGTADVPETNNWAIEGDFLTTTVPGKPGPYKLTAIMAMKTQFYPHVIGWQGVLEGFTWPTRDWHSTSPQSATFSLSTYSDGTQSWYSVAATYTYDSNKPVYEFQLDTIDGIVPGDKLKLLGETRTATWTVLSVDAETKKVTVKEKLTIDLAIGDRVFFDAESLGQLVFEDARTVLTRAALPYGIDLSRFKPAIFDTPVFAWLPLRGNGEDVTAVADMEAGLTDSRVFGNESRSWDGSPDAGWVRGAVTTKRADWTSQLVSAPSSLMPYDTPTLSPNTRRRNRKYDSFDSWNVNNNDGTFNPASTADIVVVLYDYISMRKVTITGTSCSIATWNGSSFNSPSSVSWPSANKVVSASVYPGLPGAVLGLTSAGTLELAFAGSLQSYTLPSTAAKGIVVTTPWAAYVVSATGYGRVMTSGGTLTMNWVDLTGEVTAFWPNTFVGIDGDNCFMMGRFDAIDETGSKRTETWGLFLTALPSTPEASVIDAERLLEGSPNLVGAYRDPSKLNRILGHVAGQMFQVSRELPATIERFSPQGMSAIECVEHVCQLHNAIAIPNAMGTMEIVSRMYIDDLYSLTVDRVSNTENRSFPNFYTVVRVSSSDDHDYYDAYGQDGGRLMEITQHPMVWGRSQCKAMAMSYSLWFGKPRKQRVEKWFHTDPDAATPWDVLPRFPKVEVNASGEYFRIMKMDKDIVRGTVTVTMVETDTAGYGTQYGRGRD